MKNIQSIQSIFKLFHEAFHVEAIYSMKLSNSIAQRKHSEMDIHLSYHHEKILYANVSAC